MIDHDISATCFSSNMEAVDHHRMRSPYGHWHYEHGRWFWVWWLYTDFPFIYTAIRVYNVYTCPGYVSRRLSRVVWLRWEDYADWDPSAFPNGVRPQPQWEHLQRGVNPPGISNWMFTAWRAGHMWRWQVDWQSGRWLLYL